jgi:hypothetical protein
LVRKRKTVIFLCIGWLFGVVFWQTLHLMNEAEEQGGSADQPPQPPQAATQPATPREIGGRQGPEPTRYGDWELRGRCIDF